MTVLEDMAGWVSRLSYEGIPERVREVARHQIVSVMGAIHAGARCSGGQAVLETVEGWGEVGACSSFPDGRARPLYSALLQNCSLSMALDYDDYLFLGHTGHSAVLVPLAVAEMRGADARTLITAQVAANEVAGRLGASVVLGPHNGQMWAHIHLLGAAAAASRVLGLNEEKTANAFGIALAEPVYALFPGFMGAQSKALTAAVPSITGTMAAFLAENGMTGSRAILEDPQGFWAHFSFLPLTFMVTGLGSAWVTDTIAFKPYPGCAYIDTAVDALCAIMRRFREEKGRDLDPKEVRRIKVEASLLTVAMDAMSREYMDRRALSPMNINFSLPVSIAIAVLAGELTGAQLEDSFLSERRDEILALADTVNLEHDARLTVDFVKSLDEVLGLKSMLDRISVRDALKARRRFSEHLSSVGAMGPREALQAWKSLDKGERAYLKSLFGIRWRQSGSGQYSLEGKRFDLLEMPFGARVSIELKDGAVLKGEKMIPRGGPGDPERLQVPVEKFIREASERLGEKGAKTAVEKLLDIENFEISKLKKLLSAGGRIS